MTWTCLLTFTVYLKVSVAFKYTDDNNDLITIHTHFKSCGMRQGRHMQHFQFKCDTGAWSRFLVTALMFCSYQHLCFVYFSVTIYLLCFVSAAVFTLVSLLVIVIALVCLIQLHTRLLDKFLPSTSQDNDSVDEPVDEHSALQTVRDFKFR